MQAWIQLMGGRGIQGIAPLLPSLPKKLCFFADNYLAGTEGKTACFRGACPSASPLIDMSQMFRKGTGYDLQ